MDVETFRYTQEGEVFVPKIAENLETFDLELGYNGVVVELDAKLDSDLRFEPVEFEGYILWKLDFGWQNLNLHDPLQLNSRKLALEHFCDVILPQHEKSIGVILYEGSARIWEKLVFTENFKEQLQDSPIELFSLTLFSEYLHLLGAVLPEGVPPFALFDCTGVEHPLALFNNERFPHVELGLKGVDFPIFGLRWQEGEALGGFLGRGAVPKVAPPETTLGIVIPEGDYYNPKIEKHLAAIDEPYRLIFESSITTSWDELAELKHFDLSPMGERMVDGFAAAGGAKNKISG